MNEKVEFDNGNSEEELEERPEKRTKRKSIYLEDETEKRDVTFRMTQEQLDTLREKAGEKSISMSSYIREALIKSFSSDIPEETKKKIDKLLEDCSAEEGGFSIEDEDGFLNQVATRDLTEDIWTPEQLDRVAEKFVIGYEGYFFPPDVGDLSKRFVKAMKLDKTQEEYFGRKIVEVAREHGIDARYDEEE